MIQIPKRRISWLRPCAFKPWERKPFRENCLLEKLLWFLSHYRRLWLFFSILKISIFKGCRLSPHSLEQPPSFQKSCAPTALLPFLLLIWPGSFTLLLPAVPSALARLLHPLCLLSPLPRVPTPFGWHTLLFFVRLFFFLRRPFFKSLYWLCCNSVASILCCGFWLRGLWVLISLTRDGAHTPELEGEVLTTGLPGRLLACVSSCCIVAKLCPTLLWPHGLQPARLLCLWDFPGKNTGVGLSFHSPGHRPNPGIEPTSPASKVDTLPLSHLGSPYFMLLDPTHVSSFCSSMDRPSYSFFKLLQQLATGSNVDGCQLWAAEM